MRPQEVVLPILRTALPGASVVSVIPDVDHRTYPLVLVARTGGPRNPTLPRKLSLPVVELAVFHDLGLAEAEELYEDTLEALCDAVKAQTVVESVGYLHSLTETQGATQSASPFSDTWYVHGSVRVGVRPTRVAVS